MNAPLAARRAAALRLPWPLPALVGWAAAWTLYAGLSAAAAPPWLAPAAASAVGVALSMLAGTRMRRAIVALGFPVSLLVSGLAAGLPAWAWLLPLAALAIVYPFNAWRDAPLFPTPVSALDGLAALAPLPPGATVLDAGCGLGHGLAALRQAYPQARLRGVEWSWPIALAAKLRCRAAPLRARVRRGDMWSEAWRGCALVYLFQRPESMERAVAKARRELADGAWLASLEFPAAGLLPQAVLNRDAARPVWLYRQPFVTAAEASSRPPAQAARRRRR